MALRAGTRIGPYEIASQIGAGGMGEVYRAHDTKLNRDVAIKVLSDAFIVDEDRRARLTREAQVLASLNHPNIATIHGFEEHALILELVEGLTLAERIVQGPVPLDEALAIARQIAAALEAAHDCGVIHRDLKPANIKLRPDGMVKVLDFGLAKLIDGPPGRDVVTDPAEGRHYASISPTMTTPALTNVGVMLGTTAYMSPEQARGRTLDKRADIWSFGVVLYELTTGRRPFRGEDVSDTLASVIKDEPNVDDVPDRLRPLIQRCLQKDPAKRLKDIGDAWALVDAASISVQHAPASTTTTPDRWRWAGVVATLATGLVVTLWAPWREDPAPLEPVRFEIPVPENRMLANFAVSPDGRKVVMQVRRVDGLRLWVRSLDSLDARELTGAETSGAPPFWSHDSRWIAFNSPDGKLKKIAIDGGPAQTVCDFCSTVIGGTWSRNEVILFSDGSQLRTLPATGGTPVAVRNTGGQASRSGFVAFPSFLSDGQHFVYAASGSVSLASVDGSRDPVTLVSDAINRSSGSGAVGYVPGVTAGHGKLLFFRGTTVMAQTFDERTLSLQGAPASVAEGARFFWAARDALLYDGAGDTLQLTWLAQGQAVNAIGEKGMYEALAISPDARRVALVKRGETGRDLWLMELTSGRSERLTFTGTVSSSSPSWSSDGQQIVFSDFGQGGNRVLKKWINSADEPELLFTASDRGYVTSLSADGRYLLHMILDREKNTRDVGLVTLEGGVDGRTTTRLMATPFDETDARFSPDSRWIAYKSNETGRTELYVRRFTPGSAGQAPALGSRYLVSKGEPLAPVQNLGVSWRADSKALMYLTDNGLMTSEVGVNAESPFGEPKLLFAIERAAFSNMTADVTADGRRVLVAVPAAAAASQGLTVVLNWQTGLP